MEKKTNTEHRKMDQMSAYHRRVDYYIMQVLRGHGVFRAYASRIGIRWIDARETVERQLGK